MIVAWGCPVVGYGSDGGDCAYGCCWVKPLAWRMAIGCVSIDLPVAPPWVAVRVTKPGDELALHVESDD